MSYYDWQHLTKPLQFEPVEQDTTVNTKALSHIPVEDVHTGFIQIKVPQSSFTITDDMIAGAVVGGSQILPYIVGQFNYTVGQNFVILNQDAAYQMPGGNYALCVRYRVGSVSYRYILGDPMNFTNGFLERPSMRSLLPFPRYAGQVLKSNFVIEVWLIRPASIAGVNEIIHNNYYLNTGVLYVPTSLEDSSRIVEPSQILDRTDLVTPLPETVPTIVNDSGPWLSN